jgi:hypothetical protein
MNESDNIESNNTNRFLNTRTIPGRFLSISQSHPDCLVLYTVLGVCLPTMAHLLKLARWELRLDQGMLSVARYIAKATVLSNNTINRTQLRSSSIKCLDQVF